MCAAVCTHLQEVGQGLDPRRDFRPLEHEEYARGETGASILCGMLARLNKEKIAWGDPPQAEVHDALLRFGYVLERATYWLKAMGTLMARQIELGVQSRR